MDYVVGWKGELGLKEYGSWSRYLNLTTCLLLDDATPQILQAVHELMDELKLEPWDAKKYTGLLRYCVIRIGRNTNERMITLVVKDVSRITQHIERIKEKLVPFCTTLYLGENPEITDLSYAKTFTLLHGNTYLTEEVNGLHYRIHPNSFFQTNTDMASVLQTTVLKKLGDAKSVLDLYCGLGFFGIAAAKQGKTVYGHELDAPAIELAKTNAELNGVRADFGAGPVEKLDWKSKKPDAVIVDPPRAGLHPKALQALMENAPPTIIYVSCNFHRLVEELKQLKSVYRVASIEALDLFPQTPHVEVVTQLIRR
jgi:23S rRNA (uracil-5-)-methyltransferase RumA